MLSSIFYSPPIASILSPGLCTRTSRKRKNVATTYRSQIGVYHQENIRLVKCSSNYSQLFENIDLDDDASLGRLKSNVQIGVWFHFSKFYIVLTPFYCGVRPRTTPLLIAAGVLVGFVLM